MNFLSGTHLSTRNPGITTPAAIRVFPNSRVISALCAAALFAVAIAASSGAAEPTPPTHFPPAIQTVLDQTRPLTAPRGSRLPLLVLPISNALAGAPDAETRMALTELNRRGIAYSVAWNFDALTNSIAEALRIARFQRELGMWVAVDASGCVGPFFDGTDATLHEDDAGKPFAETSFGGRLGCPFALEHRIPHIRSKLDAFLDPYKKAGLTLDFVFADWEVDGPIEWNDAWSNSRKCRRCRANLPGIEDFRTFQRALRAIRSHLQREAFASPVTSRFPEAKVGNYGVHPHDGFRYWYDYFEKQVADGIPFRADHRARYREWADEFSGSGYNSAIPVIYTWYPTFGWYDFADPDYRWFYNMLLEGSSTGRNTPTSVPLVTFVHWTTTAPPEHPDPRTLQFSPEKYQDLLRHLILRGHDTYFLWCMPEELSREIRLVHEVYAEGLQFREFLDEGRPVSFEVPNQVAPVISGLRLKDRVLVLRTDFGTNRVDIGLHLQGGGTIDVPSRRGWQTLEVHPTPRTLD